MIRQRAGVVLTIITIAALTACGLGDGPTVTGINTGLGGGGGGGGGGSLDAALVGEWGQNQVDGLGNSVQTRWTFGSDATVSEQVITTPSGGSPTAVTSSGEWQTADGTLTVVFSAPDSSSAQFGYVVTGDTLTLNGVAYVKGQ
jgi:hypothetical protein